MANDILTLLLQFILNALTIRRAEIDQLEAIQKAIHEADSSSSPTRCAETLHHAAKLLEALSDADNTSTRQLEALLDTVRQLIDGNSAHLQQSVVSSPSLSQADQLQINNNVASRNNAVHGYTTAGEQAGEPSHSLPTSATASMPVHSQPADGLSSTVSSSAAVDNARVEAVEDGNNRQEKQATLCSQDNDQASTSSGIAVLANR
jgi:hypothetical protein